MSDRSAVLGPAGPAGWHLVRLGAAVALAYVLAAQLGFRFAFVAEQVTTVWAPSGIGIAALLIWGFRMSPAIWAGAFLANASFDVPLWAAAAIASGNALEAVAAGAALALVPRFDPRLRRLNDAVAFILLAAGAATAVSATIGVLTLSIGGLQPWGRFGELWRAWWLGDAVGALVVAPLLLSVSAPPRNEPLRAVDAVLLVSGTLVTTHVIFGFVSGSRYHPVEFLIFPLVVAAALRGGLRLTALVVLAAAAVSIANTARGVGPFASPQVHDSLVLLQIFIAVLAGTGLVLAAAVTERETGERRRAAAARVGEVLASAPDLRSASQSLLESICSTLGWQVGSLWLVDESHSELRCFDVWSEPHLETSTFVAQTRARTFEQGVGLPGRIWASRAPAWIVNVVTDTNFPRAPFAQMAGLHGAMGFPVQLGDEFLGVIELFNRTAAPPDPDLLQTMSTVGHQIGQFIGRKREEAVARHSERERELLLAREAAARSEAEAANRAKDEFLATLSHELRTPLNAIVGWTRILAEGRLDQASTQHALEVIERNAHLQSQLVADILDVSRIVTGKVRLDLRPVELGSIVGAALDAVRPAAAARQVALRAKLGAPRVVQGDPERLQQVVWNLLSNAVKFSATGGAVDIELDAVDGRAVRLRVSDRGAGIDRDFLPHVFERFRQADGSLSRQHGGLGLGLAIVRHLVELHGGTVRAESEGKGLGAIFTVELPAMDLALDPAQPVSSAATALASSDLTAATLTGHRVLVVDDHHDSRELVAAMLRASGAIVDVACSVDEALEKLERSRPDVLLSDIGMPDQDGFTLLREVRLRDSANGHHLPAVAVTAYAGSRDRERALAAGFDGHLAKPVSREALVDTVLALCQDRSRST